MHISPIAARGVKEAQEFTNVTQKISKAQQPFVKNTYVAFEPFSPMIVKQLRKTHFSKQRQELFESILNDSRAEVFYQSAKAKTTIYPNNRGKVSKTWDKTKNMAVSLNEYGSSVSFLPEYLDKSSADAIAQFMKRWLVADFKYCTTANYNTIAEDLIKGFKQAECVVLQMTKGDAGTFRDVIAQLQRKKSDIGNIVLINKYGKVFELNKTDLLSGKYLKKIRGKL